MVTIQEHSLSVWRGQIQCRVRVAGQGPPLVYLHGAAGLMWDDFLEGLTQTHTIYAPEHPGTSPGDPDAIKPLDDLWDLVLYYYELFDGLGLESPAVVGHSFGGMVASEIAATDPSRVSRLVLLNPIGLWRDDAPVKNWMVMSPDDLGKELFSEPDGPVARRVLAEPEDPEERMTAKIQGIWNLGCTGKFTWPIPDKGLSKRLHRVQAPTLVIWGQQDGIVPQFMPRSSPTGFPGQGPWSWKGQRTCRNWNSWTRSLNWSGTFWRDEALRQRRPRFTARCPRVTSKIRVQPANPAKAGIQRPDRKSLRDSSPWTPAKAGVTENKAVAVSQPNLALPCSGSRCRSPVCRPGLARARSGQGEKFHDRAEGFGFHERGAWPTPAPPPYGSPGISASMRRAISGDNRSLSPPRTSSTGPGIRRARLQDTSGSGRRGSERTAGSIFHV